MQAAQTTNTSLVSSLRRTPRDYQVAARDAIWHYYASGKRGNPVVALPTGTGKSLVQADFVEQVMKLWPDQKFLLLTHVKELIQQNVKTLVRQWAQAPVGIVSSGLKRAEWGRPIIFAGIGSVYRHTKKLGKIDIVFIDECHLVSDDEDSMYRVVIDALLEINPAMKVIGLSATPWRMGLGHIIDGKIFTDVAYDATTLVAFNWFIDQGYLVPLVPMPTHTKLDTDGVKLQGGEFNQKSLQRAVDKDEITESAIREALSTTVGRKHCLVFATGIEHAEHIRDMLESFGEDAVVVHSKMPEEERDDNLNRFKSGEVRWCCNVNVLTTGYDHPDLDCIVMLRPTKSPGLWLQMLGRLTRPSYASGFDLDTVEGRLDAIRASNKQAGLVLDFAGNTASLGPINDPKLPKKKGEGGGVQPVKQCRSDNVKRPEWAAEGVEYGCGALNHPSVRHCVNPNCGLEFVFNVKITDRASSQELVVGLGGSSYAKPLVVEHNVTRVTYERHTKTGRPDSIKVNYYCGMRRFTKYLCPEHMGMAKAAARDFWMRHGGGVMPDTVTACCVVADDLRVPAKIRVHEKKDHPEVIQWIFDEKVPT